MEKNRRELGRLESRNKALYQRARALKAAREAVIRLEEQDDHTHV